MNFEISDDQRMLKDSVDRLIAEKYQLDHRLRFLDEPKGWSEDLWSDFVELGLTILPFPEEVGGLGLGPIETMIVGEAFGRGLVVEPYLPSIVLSGAAFLHGAGDRAADFLAPIMTGGIVSAVADLADVSFASGSLNGSAKVVLGGDCADLFIIPSSDGEWLVRRDAPGLSARGYRLHGGGGAADLVFDGVKVEQADRLADGSVQAAREAGIAFLAAEAVGAMQAALDTTVEYLKTRVQFGVAIGTYQALQHRATEMLIEVEQARSAAMYAAIMRDEGDPLERAKGLSAVKAVIGKAGRLVGQGAVQLHGGIGVSEEHAVSHWFRRLAAIGVLLGDTEWHIKSLASCGGFTGPQPHFATEGQAA